MDLFRTAKKPEINVQLSVCQGLPHLTAFLNPSKNSLGFLIGQSDVTVEGR